MDDTPDKARAATSPQRPARRKRYRGDHPRRFDERYKELAPEVFPDVAAHVREQGKTPAGTHVPIMVPEIVQCLDPHPGDVVVDCTLGHGGHAVAFLTRIGPRGLLLGLDADGVELDRTRVRLQAEYATTLRICHANFEALRGVLWGEGIEAADVIFADLGVSSMQVDDPVRGFSYKSDGPLDMRMDHRARQTAADLVATRSVTDLALALRDLADEEDASAVAEAIVAARTRRPILTTAQLAHVVLAAKGLSWRGWREALMAAPNAPHPAAKTFQALRILVNDELGSLSRLLAVVPDCLKPGGRIGILSFHSGEDRLVKGSFRDGLRGGVYDAVAEEVLRPSSAEIRSNPRAAPARLRWARRAAGEEQA